jgi:hypothetical protein
MRCLSCNYSLDNLAEDRCPECGEKFDPKDPCTFDPACRLFITKRLVWVLVALGLFAYFGSYFGLLSPVGVGEASSSQHLLAAILATVPVALLLIMFMVFYVAISLIRQDRSHR